MPLPEKFSNIATLRLTWVEPVEESYSLYKLRPGSVQPLEGGSGIRFDVFDGDGYDDDVEIILRETPTGAEMRFDYEDEAVTLPLRAYGNGPSALYVHESEEHLVYLTIDRSV